MLRKNREQGRETDPFSLPDSKEKRVLLRLENVKKTYPLGLVTVEALRDISLTLYQGELVVILGPSGSGKTTLLHLLGGMAKPTAGQIFFCDQELGSATEKERTLYRRYAVGFVFQFYNLFSDLTAGENVALAAELVKNPLDLLSVMGEVSLTERMHHFPAQMSGGEQQRVSIARALVKGPSLLLCDEPTGALDEKAGREVLSLLKDVVEKKKRTVVIVTHNQALALLAHRVFSMRDGCLVSMKENQNPLPVERIQW